MNSRTTMMKLVMRDFATCFTACAHPPGEGGEDEEQGTNSSTSTDPPPKPKAHTTRREKRIHHRERKKDTLTEIRRYQERFSKESSQRSKSSKAVEVDTGDDSSLLSLKEEEFLDFCFKEDGEIEMVKESRNSRSLEKSSARSIRTKKPTPHYKANHGDSAQQVSEVDRGSKDDEGETTLLYKLADEQHGTDTEAEWPPDEIKEVHHVESAESKTVSGEESSDSNGSEASSGSFAFPVLSWEWMGSPVQMPKADGTRFRRRRHKPRAVPLHCCRF